MSSTSPTLRNSPRQPAGRRLRGVVLFSAALAMLAVAAVPASAQSHRWGTEENQVRLRLGQFEPEGESAYWTDTFDVFDGDVSNFDDVSFGADFVLALGSRSSLVFSGDIYEAEDAQSYLDFVDGSGGPITHLTTVRVASATVAYRFALASRESRIVPYLGAGGGIYDWELEESGDFIDFGVEPLEIFTDTFVSGDTTFGWYWLAGLEVPINPQWSVFAEGRWQDVEGELDGDFEGFGDIDLSGQHLYGGFAWTF